MINQEYIREDLYNTIKTHYEQGDYTEALRDAMFFVKDLLQDKSGLIDKDNTKLIEACLLGRNAAIKINKYDTESEINFQEGIGFALKGLVLHLRNPISHDRIEYSEQDADAQLLYINYLVNQIDNSSGRRLITDWMDYLHSESFTTTKSFAQELIKELPRKKQYDLLVNIWRQRSSFKLNSITCFVNELVNNMSAREKASFIDIMNVDLINCVGDNDLCAMFCFFSRNFYNNLKRLIKIHVEDIVKKGIKNGSYVDGKINGTNSSCAIWANRCLDLFVTKDEIIKLIRNRFMANSGACAYIENFFHKFVDLNDAENLEALKESIKAKLKNGYQFAYDIIKSYEADCVINNEIWECNPIYIEFSKEIEFCKEVMESYEPDDGDIPF